jgi:hypothetical protein
LDRFGWFGPSDQFRFRFILLAAGLRSKRPAAAIWPGRGQTGQHGGRCPVVPARSRRSRLHFCSRCPPRERTIFHAKAARLSLPVGPP